MNTKLHTATLKSKENISPKVKSLRFDCPDPSFSFQPGQWLDLYLENNPEAKCVGYSFASSPLSKGEVEILVRANPKNALTTQLHETMNLGDKVFISSGQGKFFLDLKSPSPKLLLAGGMGLAPLLSMVRTYALSPECQAPLLLVHSVRDPEELLHHQELEALVLKDKRIHYLPYLSGEGRLNAVYVRSFLDLLRDIEPDCYICGPGTMNEDLKNILLAFNIKKEKIKTEKWW